MKKIFLFTITILYLSTSMSLPSLNFNILESLALSKPANSIVLIFHLSEGFSEKKYQNKNIKYAYTPSLSYINNKFQEVILHPKNTDTIRISTGNSILLQLTSIPRNYFYFLPGDTIIFENNTGYLKCDLLNRQSKEYDFSFFTKVGDYINTTGNSKQIMITSGKENEDRVLYNNLKSNYSKRCNYLDSVNRQGKISYSYYLVFKASLNFDFLSIMQIKDFAQFSKNDIKTIFKSSMLNADSLIYFQFYQNFLTNYINNKVVSAAIINKKKHSYDINNQAAYDTVLTIFDKSLIRDYLLLYFMRKIQQGSSTSDFIGILNKFKEDIGNKLLADEFNVYSYDLDTTQGGKSLLRTLSGQFIELSDLLKKYNGYIVYLDIWASWCLPCRKLSPLVKDLKEKFKNKKIIFLYLSVDKDITAWEKACIEDNLIGDTNNYILLHAKDAQFTKDINLQEIPRYLIYNKAGKLIYMNAPNPGNDKIQDLLMECLSKE